MKVERGGSSRPTPRPTPVAGAGRAPEIDSPELPEESWDGPTDYERETATSADEPCEQLSLPGIEQGLTQSYLTFRSTPVPTTLMAAYPAAPFSLKEFPDSSNAAEPGLRYASNLASHTRALFREFFGEVYLNIELLLKFETTSTNNAGYEWVRGRSRLTLQCAQPPPAEKPHRERTIGSLETGHRFRRGVSDLISFVHEYAHATYDGLLGVPASVDVSCANRSFSEGFAVLLELLAIDQLLKLPAHRMYEQDAEDLTERRAQRVRWLQQVLERPVPPAHMAYAEGTELMANLYRAGGMEGVSRFVRAVVPNKANSLFRSHPEYRLAVGLPEKMGSLVF